MVVGYIQNLCIFILIQFSILGLCGSGQMCFPIKFSEPTIDSPQLCQRCPEKIGPRGPPGVGEPGPPGTCVCDLSAVEQLREEIRLQNGKKQTVCLVIEYCDTKNCREKKHIKKF